ncbi:MAG: hypothetical protein AB7F89_18095 [Pirellulaceae bacterium]
MQDALSQWIWLAGWAQLSVLLASALVPWRLNWRAELAGLPPLMRQLFWVYGGYTVLTIVGLSLISLANADELASGSTLARFVCGFAAVFWGVRLCLQACLKVRPYLTASWLWAGDTMLTIWFAGLAAVFTWAAWS